MLYIIQSIVRDAKSLFKYLSIGASLLLLFSCSEQNPKTEHKLTIIDGLHRTIHIKSTPQRVISLCPSQTECLLQIIDPAQLIAVTPYCNYPAHITAQKVKINSYPPDYESIVKLKPDLVVTLKGLTKPDEIKKMEELGITVLVQKADSLKHLAQNFRQLGAIFNRQHKGDSIAQLIENRLMRPTDLKSTKTFLFLFSLDPIYAFGEGNYLNEVFENNGFKNIINKAKFNIPFPIVSREYIIQHQADYLFASSGNIITGLRSKYPEMQNLSVFKTHQIDSIDVDICSRPTLRLLKIDSLLKTKHPK
jgi:iron complex transport system substrate-binding protein